MAERLTLILGGARSGKSSYAEQAASRLGGRVLYVATAQPGDEEMTARIAAHQAARPANWETLEAASRVGQAIEAWPGQPDVILVDCLTLLASNVLLELGDLAEQAAADSALDAEISGLLDAQRARPARWLIVSNEVGLGLVPPYPLGRVYRDALGRANQRLAAAADNVLFMVAGLPLVVKGGLPTGAA